MNMDTDSRQGFSLPNTEGDSNVTPGGGGVISLGGSSVECCKKSTCATDDDITADEEDLINRLYNLLGHRWPLIAGRFPWRRVEEIENYCKIKWPQDGYTVSTSCSRS